MNPERLRHCEGYCSGMVKVKDYRTTKDGERFCKECYETWKDNYDN